jgi:hypothetical protein
MELVKIEVQVGLVLENVEELLVGLDGGGIGWGWGQDLEKLWLFRVGCRVRIVHFILRALVSTTDVKIEMKTKINQSSSF